MGLRETIIRRLGGHIEKGNPIPASRSMSLGGIASAISSSSQRGNLENFLRAYGENPWLHAGVTRVAESVGETVWRYMEIDNDGDQEEITDQNDPLKISLNCPNMEQTGQDLMELTQKFLTLTGKAYWVVQDVDKRNKDKMKIRGAKDFYLIPSPWFHPVCTPGTTDIVGYMWDKEGQTKPFAREMVIPFVITDPFNMLDGVGPAQTIGDDIDIMNFQRLVNKYFFYYGADPGTIISFKDDLTKEESERITQVYNAAHQSYGRSHKLLVIGGDATVSKEGVNRRDMEFIEGEKWEKETILGALGISGSVIGTTDNVIRANAEAQNFVFAQMTLRPKLQFIKRKLNKYCVPLFYQSTNGKRRELTFTDPTPENTQLKADTTDAHVRSSIYSIEEGRQVLELGDINPDDHFLVPISMQVVTGAQLQQGLQAQMSAQLEQPKALIEGVKKKFGTDEWRARNWKAFVQRAESYEPKTIQVLNAMFDMQKGEALRLAREAVAAGNRRHVLLDLKDAQRQYHEAMKPILTEVITHSVNNAREQVQGGAKVATPPPKTAIDWLLQRLAWAADQISQDTADELAQILSDGFENGLSIDEIAANITNMPGFSTMRATRIARTEIIGTSNQGALSAYESMGVQKKEWFAALDERTRDTHIEANGQIKDIDEDFDVGGGSGPAPGQIGLPSEDINCRCILLPVAE